MYKIPFIISIIFWNIFYIIHLIKKKREEDEKTFTHSFNREVEIKQAELYQERLEEMRAYSNYKPMPHNAAEAAINKEKALFKRNQDIINRKIEEKRKKEIENEFKEYI